jgi:energy-coupling factor transport system substrate-specific component
VASPAGRAERWLMAAQNKDGGFGPVAGASSSRLYSGWAGLGLAAAGRNPRDVQRRAGRSLAAYVLRDARAVKDIGEVERTVLLLAAAGLSPRDFGGRDLLDTILAKRRADGSIAGYVSYTAFGVLALRSAKVSPGRKTVAWLVGAQNADGGYGLVKASSSESDMTGAVLQALATVGRKRSGATQRAVGWLRANQNDDGGFGQFRGRPSNAQSTAYALQGLVAAGAGGATLTRGLAYLRGLQRRDGHVAYSSSSNQTPVWVTAQALMALERKPLPIAAVARAPKPKPKRKPEREAAAAAPAKQKPKPKADPAPSTTPGPGGGSDVETHAELVPKSPGEGTLTLDRTSGEGSGDSGPPAWAFVAAVLAVLALLFALRRKLVPAAWHSQRE